jgi:REP element-mobilizing transposase RayT
MRSARHELVSTSEPGYYHCVSRCVRRAFLCGEDHYSGRSFTHRKQWIEDRLLELAALFAIGVYAYAVMSNHVHVVVHVDPTVAARWSASEVGTRWSRLFPVRSAGRIDESATQLKANMIAADGQRVAICRERLASLSWFMRCLNEPIARMANHEDACTGRFWEGRYKCQALLDETAVLACMTYVDLNPVRAGFTTDLSSSSHTSIHRRLRTPAKQSEALQPIAGSVRGELSPSSDEYVLMVEWTGSRLHPGKRGRIVADVPGWMRQRRVDPEDWSAQVASIETRYWRAIGSIEALIEKARAIGRRWLKGGGRRRTVLQPQ